MQPHTFNQRLSHPKSVAAAGHTTKQHNGHVTAYVTGGKLHINRMSRRINHNAKETRSKCIT